MGLDKYYTKPDSAKRLVEIASFHGCDSFVEPSAGSGSISSLIQGCIAYDIKPEAAGIIEKDWLTVESLPENCCVIGNPPFGRRSELAVKFINHAFEIGAKRVAFILPRVFRKYTIQAKIDKRASLIMDCDLPHDSFTLYGEDYSIPCCIQVWQVCGRESSEVEPSELFRFDKKGKWFIFGAAPSKVIRADEVNKNNRGYYIDSDISEMCKKINWNGNSSASGGVAWFTKQEISRQINEHMRAIK